MNEFIGYLYGWSTRAVLFCDHFWSEPKWLPRSQLKAMAPMQESDEVHIRVMDWICRKNDLKEAR